MGDIMLTADLSVLREEVLKEEPRQEIQPK